MNFTHGPLTLTLHCDVSVLTHTPFSLAVNVSPINCAFLHSQALTCAHSFVFCAFCLRFPSASVTRIVP